MAARRFIDDWVTDYNTARPHASLRCQTPADYTEAVSKSLMYMALPRGIEPLFQP
ncbi:integrase core domain-containing protein [Pseudorhodoplanes sp.]|uniref:integrase core domain-containing protein n=1 Tax=Pseudorhodoplanes sp. TaxID=1934341 RepID=UPI00391C0B96